MTTTNHRERTSLHQAVKQGCNKVVNMMLQNSPKMTPGHIAVTDDMGTPLHLAAQHGHNDVVTTLLKRKVQINVKDLDSNTPLHLTARSGQSNVVNLLLDYYGAEMPRYIIEAK